MRRYAFVAVLFLFLVGCSSKNSAAPTCLGSSTACAGSCVELASDNANCGACGTVCTAGEMCSAGTCALSCQAGLVKCGEKCVDPLVDPLHCGADANCQSGTVCTAGEVCSAGTCALSCQAGLVKCEGRCIDPMADRAFCGASGTCGTGQAGAACRAGEVCSAGTCALSCQAGLVKCEGKCADPLVDPLHCGADANCQGGAICLAGNVCNQGTCQLTCLAGLVACEGKCIDPSADRAFCGASGSCQGGLAGTVCQAGEVCSAGSCTASCPTGQHACGGHCVDPLSDPTYCGAAADCSGGQACGGSQVCYQGACYGLCGAGQVFCGGSCIDPQTSLTHCGASGTCTGALAGVACAASFVCNGGICGCPAGQIACGGSCLDPQTSPTHCGASGSCTGASAGVACAAGLPCSAGVCGCPAGQILCGGSCVNPSYDPVHCGCTGGSSLGTACTAPNDTCVSGTCAPWPGADFVWTARSPSDAPPFFPDGPDTLAHIRFDGSNMVDSTGHTHWAAVGTPPGGTVGMWTPAQSYSGPFSGANFWRGDAATKTYLDANTAGDFTICARFKPGQHPGNPNPNKVLMANGTPEAPLGSAGWALMQMHEAYCFHYHDDTAQGEWMAPSIWTANAGDVVSLTWSWMCGGRDGNAIRLLRESFASEGLTDGTSYMPFPIAGRQMGPVGVFRADADNLPTIGAYDGGIDPLWDGGIYEIVISSLPATTDNMRKLVTGATGGVRAVNQAPVPFAGSDSATYQGAPSSLVFQTDGTNGYILGDQQIDFGAVARAASTATGVCYGLDAAASNWATVVSGVDWNVPLEWVGGTHWSQIRWMSGMARICVNVSDGGPNPNPNFIWACHAPPTLADGSRHTFMNCFDPATGTMRAYVDGTVRVTETDQNVPGPIPLSLFPRLDVAGTRFVLRNVTPNLRVYRVFACSTADPTRCP